MTKIKNTFLFRSVTWLAISLSLPWASLATASTTTATMRPSAPSSGQNSGTSTQAFADSADDSTLDEPADANPETMIRPGFLLQLSSANDSRINGRFRVQQDGSIQLPYSVRLSTLDLSLAQMQEKVLSEYAKYFRGTPSVQVMVRQKRYWVEVGGLVGHPGVYLVKERTPLDEVISTAGGFTEDTNAGFARIEQKDGIHWVDLDDYFKHGQASVPAWKGADKIFFQLEGPDGATLTDTPNKVQVIGEVKKPGPYTYQKHADGYYYLTATGGPTTFSDLEHVELIRTDPGSGQRIKVAQGPLSNMRDIRESDVLIVDPVRPSSGERTLTIVSIATSIVTASLLAYVAVRGNR